MANEGEDSMSFSFSKIKGKFNRDKSSDDEMAFDLSKAGKWLKDHKNFIIYGLLIVLLLFSGKVLFTPESKYTGIYENSLSAMDPYWHYRHAENVYDHGYVGDTKVCYNEKLNDAIPNTADCPPGYDLVAWDTMHDAPMGGRAYQEFYPYFSAYSYKAVGRFVAPNLLVWHRWTPAIFGVLAVLGMFLLVKQFFGPYAGLASGFVLTLSSSFITRSVSGFADSDAVIAFFTVFTFYFFAKAWDSESFLYAFIGGACLGLFGLAWNAYKFAPLLMFGLVGFYFVFNVLQKYLIDKPSIFSLVQNHFSENWKKYVCFVIVIVLGVLIIGIARGFGSVNIFSAITVSRNLKVTEVISTSMEGESVRNVYKTVAEMNPANLRQILARLHIAPVLLSLGFLLLLPLGLWKKLKKNMHHVAFFSLWLAATFFMSFKATRFVTMVALPLAIFAGISIAFAVSKISAKKPVVSVIIGLSLFLLIFALPNIAIAQGAQTGPPFYTYGRLSAGQSGPSLGQNWFDFLYWARDETPKDAIFASWWDPGHSMTAVGKRPSVADGSQNSRHVHDLAIAFTTTDEALAVERLGKYNVSYFYTSSDLLNKYGAISFLANGQGENYLFLSMSEAKNTASGTVLVYPLDSETSILLNLKEDGISGTLNQGYTSQPLQRIFYINEGNAYISENPDEGAIPGLLYVDSSFRSAIFLPEHLENNMLTQLHLFNGQNLDHFEFVQTYGDEIKVFKVNYD
ncbi:MAG: STT3 domain-containing protein [Candidatus Undinarchaeales archaeon]|jgi:asparagine N-glycosylation enzyme membrane subunit Stt3|nr:STT3 domain-containing protein [Candidatus Undinarchaeales archaeon]